MTSSDTTKLSSIKYQLAKKNFYVPIYDSDQNLIFTKEDWEDSKKIFQGTRYSDQIIELRDGGSNMSVLARDELAKIKENRQNQKSQEMINSLSNEISNRIELSLLKLNVPIRKGLSLDIYGAEIIDTGSTGRGTNKADGVDFDLALVIDPKNFEDKKEQLFSDFREAFSETGDNVRIEQNGDTIRFFGAKVSGEIIDLDISIVSRLSSSKILTSDKAITEKLENISKNYGESSRELVTQQIILAKTMMSKYECYKKTYNGDMNPSGLGGIGVENWILSNNGNYLQACKNLLALVNSSKPQLTLAEFKRQYKLFDAGTNLRFIGGQFQKKHDNFIFTLNQKGYENLIKMANDSLEI